MANELTINIRVEYSKSGTEITWPDAAKQTHTITVTGTRFLHNRQAIGTSEEAIDLGDLSTGGWFFGVNRDATNYLEIRAGTALTDLVKLKAGEVCMFRISADASAPFAIANTAACDLEYWLLND